MYATFKYETIPLKDIFLDEKNPRLVTQVPLNSQPEILAYLFEHEDLEGFIRKIATEGKNYGAERPYVVHAKDKTYTVVEGNTRIAAYKVLTGLLSPPKGYLPALPHVSPKTKAALLNVDCTIAPERDALLPIVASAHFGLGDKSKWGYLGSRKAVYDEWKAGKTVAKLAKAFDRTQSQIKELIFEYLLYLEALSLSWSKEEKAALSSPSVEFNPPVRFLQTSGHKSKIGIEYDPTHLKISFANSESRKKFKHLVSKLVIAPEKGLGATATYDEVFVDYAGAAKASGTSSGSASVSGSATTSTGASGAGSGKKKKSGKQSSAALLTYEVTMPNALIAQLMKEAKEINSKKFPAAATFLLRNIVESILKQIIDQQKANPASKQLDLEGALNLCQSHSVTMSQIDKKVLKEFQKGYLSYLNLGAHGNVIPNFDALAAARDCIDQFVKRNV